MVFISSQVIDVCKKLRKYLYSESNVVKSYIIKRILEMNEKKLKHIIKTL